MVGSPLTFNHYIGSIQGETYGLNSPAERYQANDWLNVKSPYVEGLYLTGGGSMLRGLDKRISKKTKLPVYVAEDPLRAVARGTGIALKNTESYTFLIR